MILSQSLDRSLDDGKLMRFLGARRGRSKVSVGMQRRIAVWRRKLPKLISPRLVYRMVDLRSTDAGCVQLAGNGRFKSPKLARTLREAHAVCCFVATIGSALETEVRHCMDRNRFADAYVLDTLGSMTVEALVEQFHIRHEQRNNLRGRGVTLRFSPGYCDWPIMDQVQLFAQFGTTPPAGIKLTETGLMTPRKSISGLFGLLAYIPDVQAADYNPCRSCSQSHCLARRAPSKKQGQPKPV